MHPDFLRKEVIRMIRDNRKLCAVITGLFHDMALKNKSLRAGSGVLRSGTDRLPMNVVGCGIQGSVRLSLSQRQLANRYVPKRRGIDRPGIAHRQIVPSLTVLPEIGTVIR